MYIYVVCPVRLGISKQATEYVAQLEAEGHKVFYPPRDVDQDDPIGFFICKSERTAIERANRIDILYDARSQGQHFDLGMAFALRKPIKIIDILMAESNHYPDHNVGEGKGYLKMLGVWEEHGPEAGF